MYRKNLVATIEEREGGVARQVYGIKKYKLYFIFYFISYLFYLWKSSLENK